MVDKTILVVGEVTRDQYQVVQQEVVQQGHTPTVRSASYDEVFLDGVTLIESYGNTSPNDVSIDDWGEVTNTCAQQHLGLFGDIHAVVMDEGAWDRYSVRSSVAWALQDNNAEIWAVENGKLLMVG